MKRLIRRLLRILGYEIHRIRKDASPESDIAKSGAAQYRALYPEDSLLRKRFYNIGAGSFSHPFWTNVDNDSEWYAFNREKTLSGIQYDLLSLETLPVKSDIAEAVYSSHTIEHITNTAAQHMFNEAHRILKPGGYIRITSPDIDLFYRAYRDGDRAFFYWYEHSYWAKGWRRLMLNRPPSEASIDQLFLHEMAASVSTLHSDGAPRRIDDEQLRTLFREMDYEAVLDYCTGRCSLDVQKKYPGNHMNWWKSAKVARMLKEAGFESAYLSGYGQSHCAILRDTRFFDNTHPKISFYAEARK
jgi:SAM-dependent methyltransferase